MPGYPVNGDLEPTTENWRISQHCFSEEIRSQMTLPEKFQLCDITLREGRQLPGVSLRRDEVIRIADALVDAGVSMVQMHHDDPLEIEEVKKRPPRPHRGSPRAPHRGSESRTRQGGSRHERGTRRGLYDPLLSPSPRTRCACSNRWPETRTSPSNRLSSGPAAPWPTPGRNQARTGKWAA